MIKIRSVTLRDADRISEIYSPFVLNTTITLEYDPPSPEAFRERINEIYPELPYLVCEADGEVVGYAYAHKFKTRFGYRFAAELSVYLDPGFSGKGLGVKVYSALIELLTLMGYKNLYGVVTDPNLPSFALHKKCGFKEVGREHLAGVKLGEWHDVVIFERIIGEHNRLSDLRECPLRFDMLDADTVCRIFEKYSME